MSTWNILLALMVAPAALAADPTDDCVDAYEADASCVSLQATIGPDISFGTGITVAPRAALGGHQSHASNPLPVGNGVVVQRNATVGVDHILGADTTIGRGATVGANVTTESGVTIGYAAQVGHDVTIEANAIVGNLAQVGDFTTVGTNAVLARSVVVMDAVNLGQASTIDGIVGPATTIGSHVAIASGARVRKNVDIDSDVQISASARIGRGAHVFPNATIHGRVGAYAIVADGATVDDGAVVERGGTLCSGEQLVDGERVIGGETFPAGGCDTTITCKTLLDNGQTVSGDYTIDPDGSGGTAPFTAYCNMSVDSGGWTRVWVATTNNYNDANLTYLPNTSGPDSLISNSTDMMVAFTNPSDGSMTNAWSFPTPALLHSQTPMAAAGGQYITTTFKRIADQTTHNRVMRIGTNSFSDECDEGSSSQWGQICLKSNTTPGSVGGFSDFPMYTGYVASNTDYCSESPQIYTTTACSSIRRFAIFVR